MPRFLFGSKNLQVPVRFLISLGSILVLRTSGFCHVPRIPRFLSGSQDTMVPVWFLGYQGSCLAPYILRFLSGSLDLQVLVWFLRSSGFSLILQIFWFLSGSQIFRFMSCSSDLSSPVWFLRSLGFCLVPISLLRIPVFCQFPVSSLLVSCQFLVICCQVLVISCQFLVISCQFLVISCLAPRIPMFLSESWDLEVPLSFLGSVGSSVCSQGLQIFVWFLGSLGYCLVPWICRFCLVPRISRFLSGSWILQVLSSLMFKSQDSSRETNSALYPGAQPFKLNSIKNKHCIVTFPLHLNLTLYTSQPSST